MITNDAARTAALLAGDVDFIDQVPTTDLANLRRDNRVRAVGDGGPPADLPRARPPAGGGGELPLRHGQ
jgi:ABC-type transport system substrate-binding protein